MSVKFEIDYEEVEKLEQKFKRIPDNIENIINSYLHKDAPKLAKSRIVSLMPLSQKKEGIHAKQSNPLRVKKINLGFEILPKRKFNYLVFPDQALGTSVGNNPDEFMQRGLNQSINDIMEGLNEHIDHYLEEEF
ncbi:hypothetical protein M948_18255 [Virgibacillus sp. CM-4]|uniref:hypothetical protein n=1 Tax=Virgibacillus sp. CM-4 TaxID=1354277 RepID=UPI00038825E1|nr:hypothetical protein [Virgibacillus sp. CM-4]EQB35043.1 hypothetical protein M948_18255 [Virgibacillus sp. CM-4]